MFIPGGCFCCEPPEDPCVLSGCTWSSTDMSDTDLTAGTAYYNPVSGTTPDGEYEITNVQDTGTGNDLPCRKITIETVVAPQKPDTVYALCWKDNATHNPSSQCPLTSVSFCVESKRHGDSDAGLSDGVVFAVRQNNRIFVTATQSVGVNWKRASGTYTQNQFTEIDGAGNPDFSVTGTAIEFGFALRLSVNEDEEPLDVVLFDNMCITKSVGCSSCAGGLCDFLSQDGWSPSVGYEQILSPSGFSTPSPVRSTVSVSPVGNPSPSIKVETVTTGLSQKSMVSLIKTGVEVDPQSILATPCKTVTVYEVCFDYMVESNPNTVDEISVRFKQGGCYFGQGAIIDSRLNSAIGTFNRGTAQVHNGDLPSQWSFSYSARTCDSSGTLTSRFDSSQPFEISIMVFSAGNTGSIGGTLSFYIDNICVKAVYGTCPSGELSAVVSGVNLNFVNSSPLCNASNVSAAETAINSTLVLAPGTNTGSTCSWSYRQSFGTGDGSVSFTAAVSLGNKVGNQYTSGTMYISAGTWIGQGFGGMRVNYTLSSPFDPCSEDGVFDYVSAPGAASCFAMTASGSITVSLV